MNSDAMWQFIEQVSGFNVVISQVSSLQIICRKEMRHLGKKESIYSEIETSRKQMQCY